MHRLFLCIMRACFYWCTWISSKLYLNDVLIKLGQKRSTTTHCINNIKSQCAVLGKVEDIQDKIKDQLEELNKQQTKIPLFGVF